MDGVCNIGTELFRTALPADSTCPSSQVRENSTGTQFVRQTAISQQLCQFSFHRCLQQRPLRQRDREAIEYQSLDVQINLHATAPAGSCHRKSASLIGRSILRNSARAASSTSAMVTGEPARAARNAALIAILWM